MSGTQTDSNGNVVPFSFTESENKNGAWLYGMSVGAGFDVMVLPKVFVRAEYEYFDVSNLNRLQMFSVSGLIQF